MQVKYESKYSLMISLFFNSHHEYSNFSGHKNQGYDEGGAKMPKKHSRQFHKMAAKLICVQKEGTIKTAEEFDISLKTVENWVTAYNKDPHCFDDCISTEQQLEMTRKTTKKQN